MLHPASRVVLRRSHILLSRTSARHNSATSQATQAASTGASKAAAATSVATSKASEGLSRVTSSASPIITGAAKSASNALKRIGGRTGRLIGFVESMIPPTVYYSKVGWELAKLVFQGQKMSPPSLSTFQSYLQPMLQMLRRPADMFTNSSNPSSGIHAMRFLSRVRNMSTQEMVATAVVAAQVLGFFTVGEIIGRFKLVGYRAEKDGHH